MKFASEIWKLKMARIKIAPDFTLACCKVFGMTCGSFLKLCRREFLLTLIRRQVSCWCRTLESSAYSSILFRNKSLQGNSSLAAPRRLFSPTCRLPSANWKTSCEIRLELQAQKQQKTPTLWYGTSIPPAVPSEFQSKTSRDKKNTFKEGNFIGLRCPKRLWQSLSAFCCHLLRLFGGNVPLLRLESKC